MKQTLIAVFTAIILFTSCDLLQRNEAPVVVEPKMLNSADSMSYVMGLNLGLNLIAADSMLNAEMVCMGIRDVYAQSHKLTDEEARNAFLKYMNWDNYERVTLPELSGWGYRIEVSDMYGRVLYNGRYSRKIGVRGLQGGHYTLRVYDRHGALVDKVRFMR